MYEIEIIAMESSIHENDTVWIGVTDILAFTGLIVTVLVLLEHKLLLEVFIGLIFRSWSKYL